MSYKIQIEKAALKQIAKLDKKLREKIISKIYSLADDPRPRGYKKLVVGGGTCRVKVDQYRILYDIIDDLLVINVISVIKRSEKTYKR